MEETKKLDDAISESNGSRSIWHQFRDIRVSLTKAWSEIKAADVRTTVTEADIMDLRSENKRIVEENGQIKHNITVTIERLMKLEKEMKDGSK